MFPSDLNIIIKRSHQIGEYKNFILAATAIFSYYNYHLARHIQSVSLHLVFRRTSLINQHSLGMHMLSSLWKTNFESSFCFSKLSSLFFSLFLMEINILHLPDHAATNE
jgi:hypothetical protein